MNTTDFSSAGGGFRCLFPPICLAVGTLPSATSFEDDEESPPSSRSDIVLLGRPYAAPHDNNYGDNERDDGDVRVGGDQGEWDELMPGYAFVDCDDDGDDKEMFLGGDERGRGTRAALDGMERVRRSQGSADSDVDDEEELSSSSVSTQRSKASYSGGTADEDVNDSTRGPCRGASPTTQQLVELMAHMRESREQLAQEQKQLHDDSLRLAPTDVPPTARPTPSRTAMAVPIHSRRRVVPPIRAAGLAGIRPSSLGRSTSARLLYPNVVAALGAGSAFDKDGFGFKPEAPTDSDEDEEEQEESDDHMALGKRAGTRFEIWRVHAYCDRDGMNGNVRDLCFEMWRATTSCRPQDCSVPMEVSPVGGGGTLAVRSENRIMTRQVSVACDWIRQLRSGNGHNNSDTRVMILSTAKDAAARNHPSYQVVSNLILNPDTSNPESMKCPSSTLPRKGPVDNIPITSSSKGLCNWPPSKAEVTAAATDPCPDKWTFVAVPSPMGLAGSATKDGWPTPHLSSWRDRFGCWKRQRQTEAVEASTDVSSSSSSATVASF